MLLESAALREKLKSDRNLIRLSECAAQLERCASTGCRAIEFGRAGHPRHASGNASSKTS
ncbi:MAG: hypothetical protein DWH97_10530 [Planctomycetota bacterium]|nr:MAG: hypothetical protein DWH97_10530 [Planctomycetota bacterium]RLS92659.1 MAG: hypothetical protein DWI12_10770 [Planctomycetota bacterium]